MAKANIKIPKGTKCGNGKVCPEDLELDIEIPETRPVVNVTPDPILSIPGTGSGQTLQQQQIPPPVQVPPTQVPQPKTYTNEELSSLMPPGVNFATCKGNNCADSKIQNKKLVTKFKQCPECGCNNVPKNSNLCPCCGKDGPEEDPEDYWEDSDIELKTKEEDDD